MAILYPIYVGAYLLAGIVLVGTLGRFYGGEGPPTWSPTCPWFLDLELLIWVAILVAAWPLIVITGMVLGVGVIAERWRRWYGRLRGGGPDARHATYER